MQLDVKNKQRNKHRVLITALKNYCAIKCNNNTQYNFKMSREKDHVNVFVRVKPLNETGTTEKCTSTAIVQVASDKEIIVYERSQEKVAKKFTFDKVFGPASTQLEVYNLVVSPLLKEVLAGYNCTVFAYGQTGTGKTYTMEGSRIEDLNLHWQNDTSAGIIPRCLSHLFDELQLLENQQYVVRVNFLELYNEELFDLLNQNGNDASKIKLYEDVSKKGSIIIHGLEEVIVRNKAEVYKILEKGSERRQTAVTLMNANSSRSHTVFSITIHMKEDTSEGEELLKTAKLNLVDLAGSENVGKSGAVDKRARETRNINQSLLTLGRVITALVEKAPHVPYRESKLTRLLQESLGGRTKTSIIATISSSSSNVDETLSTLDYAYRAKYITNRPEINQKLYKRELLKEYTEELEKLRKDLIATREKNGIYLSQDKYESMHELIEWQKTKIKEKINDLKLLEEDMKNKEKIYEDIQFQHNTQIEELMKKTNELNDLTFSLKSMKNSLKQIEDDKNEQKNLVEKYVATEKILRDQTNTILTVLDEASEDTKKLNDKLDRKIKVEKENETLELQMRNDFPKLVKPTEDALEAFKKENEHYFSSVKDEIENNIETQVKITATSINSIMKNLINQNFALIKRSTKNITNSHIYYNKFLIKNMKDTSTVVEYEKRLLSAISSKLALDIHDCLKDNESFAQNLKTLKDNISQILEDTSVYMKNIIEIVCQHHFQEYNSHRKNLSEIKEHINCMFLNEKQTVKNYKTFAKKMEHLSRELTLLDKCEKNYSESINSSHQVDEICNSMCNRASQNYNININVNRNVEEFIQNKVSQIKNDSDNNVKQAHILSEKTIKKGNVLINDLKKNVNSGCTTLKQYNNKIKFDVKLLQEKMSEDKNKIIASNVLFCKIIEDMEYNHIKFTEQQQNKISDFSKIIDNKLTTRTMELSNYNSNNKIIEELCETQRQIDKFFTEDLRRDIATGTTPPRKEFLYPRQFATTSPRKPFIQESQDRIEEVKNSDSTSMNKSASPLQLLNVSNTSKNSSVTSIKQLFASPKQLLNVSNTSKSSSVTSIKKDCKSYATSTPCNKSVTQQDTTKKSKLSLDLSGISPSVETRTCTEDNNKENVNFVKQKSKSFSAKNEKRHSLKTYK